MTLFGDLPKLKNKWQGGVVGGDGAIWCVPCDAPYALRIDPLLDKCELVGALPPRSDRRRTSRIVRRAPRTSLTL